MFVPMPAGAFSTPTIMLQFFLPQAKCFVGEVLLWDACCEAQIPPAREKDKLITSMCS